MNRGPAVAVMDVGKTSAKVVAVDQSGVVRRRLAHANRSSDAGPCRHVEVDELFEWIVEALQAVAAAEAIEAHDWRTGDLLIVSSQHAELTIDELMIVPRVGMVPASVGGTRFERPQTEACATGCTEGKTR